MRTLSSRWTQGRERPVTAWCSADDLGSLSSPPWSLLSSIAELVGRSGSKQKCPTRWDKVTGGHRQAAKKKRYAAPMGAK
jgi:hypothetical protein